MKSEEFRTFWLDHVARFPTLNWHPQESREFKVQARAVFDRMRTVEYDSADAASRMMLEMKLFPHDHIPELIRLAMSYGKWHTADKETMTSARDRARKNSVSCIDCQGSGITSRYSKAGKLVPFTCPECEMGVIVADAEYPRETGTPYLNMTEAKYQHLRMRPIGDGSLDNPHRHPPGCWDHEKDMPRDGKDVARLFPLTFQSAPELATATTE